MYAIRSYYDLKLSSEQKMSTTKLIKELAQIDILEEGKVEDNFVGRPFHLDYA